MNVEHVNVSFSGRGGSSGADRFAVHRGQQDGGRRQREADVDGEVFGGGHHEDRRTGDGGDGPQGPGPHLHALTAQPPSTPATQQLFLKGEGS